MRHIHEEYPVNVIVEPGVADELKEDLPFAFTPPAEGMFPFWGRVDRRYSCGIA